MWQATHEVIVPGLSREAVWAAWQDVNGWHRWDTDIEFARLDGPFQAGASFILKPKGGPNVTIQLLRAAPFVGYTDLATFPFARMYGVHDMTETARGLKLTITIRIEGPLAWLWRKLVAQNVADEAPAQMASLAAFAGQSHAVVA
jgi:hypothetical protein